MSESIDPLILFQDEPTEDTPEQTQSSNDEPAESEGETASEENTEAQAAEEAEPETTEEEEDSQDEESTDTEEVEGDDEEAESTEDDTVELFLDLDGEEVNLEDVRKWRKADMSEKKFTQLRQEDAKRETRNISNEARINDQSLAVGAVAQEAQTLLDELKAQDYLDDGAYDEFVQKIVTLKEGILQSEQAARNTHLNTEAALWLKRNKQWLDKDGNQDNELVKQDVSKIESYLAKEGFSQHQMSEITDHRIKVALQKAVKYDEYLATRKKKVVEIRKQVKKAKVQSKPKVSPKAPKPKTAEETLWGT